MAATAESFSNGRNIVADADVIAVSVPPGPIGVRFRKKTTVVQEVLGTSTLGGRVQLGAALLAVNGVPVTAASLDASPDILETSDDGAKLRTLTFAGSSSRVLVFQTKVPGYPVPRFPLPAVIEVSVPPGPIGVRFSKTTVHEVLAYSTLKGKVKKGAVLMAVNGVPVTAANLDASPGILETSEAGGKLRTLRFEEPSLPVALSGYYHCHCDNDGGQRVHGRAIMCDFDACICGLCIFPLPPFIMAPPYFCFMRTGQNKYQCDQQKMELADRHNGTIKMSSGCVCTPAG